MTSKTVPIETVTASESSLVEAARGGDNRAYGQIVRLHQKRLFRFIYGLVGSFDMAEDIVQESFIKAYQALDRFRVGEPFYPWLSRIARNLAYNTIAREEKKQSLESMTESGFDPAESDLGPMEKLLDSENKKRFYAALMVMPVKFRSVFVLRHFEEMDYHQIASYLKIPPGTVDSRMYRARKYLMEKLGDLL